MKYLNVASRAFNTPLLIQSSKANVISEYLLGRMRADNGLEEIKAELGDMDIMDGELMQVSDQGIAMINMHGTLVQRGGYMDASSGMLSYQILRQQMEFALEDDNIKGIVMNVDSGGGEVSGAFDLADFIYQARGQKPMYAIADELMASAAFLVGSSFDKIFVPKTGFIGSVGVLVTHMDYSKQLEAEGVNVTQVFAGDRKLDGSPYSPLTAEAFAGLQEDITEIYGMFTELVSRNREISLEWVVNTQASTFMGQKAVDIGFADDIATFDNVINSIIGSVKPSLANKGMSMKGKKANPIAASEQIDADIEEEVTPTDETELEASAESEEVIEDVIEEDDAILTDEDDEQELEDAGEVARVAQISERARIRDITTCEEAQGNENLAEHFAYNTDMSVEDAIAALAASQPQAGSSSFKEKMSKEATPKVRVDKKQKQSASKKVSRIAAIVQSTTKGAK